MFRTRLKVGELVEVRSKEEILATLDANGCLDGLPFMPEMFRFCGQRFPVFKRAHKTCDTVFPIRSRRMADGVHLETRCDGAAHGGCQAGCLIFWKEAWLKRVGSAETTKPQTVGSTRCTEADVLHRAAMPVEQGSGLSYVCQATRLPYATTDLRWWDLRQYAEDYLSGNVGLNQIVKGTLYKASYFLNHAGIGLGPVIRWFYNNVNPRFGGVPWPTSIGHIPKGQVTPTQSLHLKPGDRVRVKPLEEILRTINKKNLNRGMTFDKEMVPYCGGEYRVLKRVTKIINEKTGRMQELKNPCIVLDSVVCQSRYSECRLFCPRAIYPYWREIWLERVSDHESGDHPENRAQIESNGSGAPPAWQTAGAESQTSAVGASRT